jgi:flavin reductase (DIM6/NTAB) family NADH-FMN oxidoreductase RutF
MDVDVSELRRTLGMFTTGVTLVTTVDDLGSPRGMTANSFTSVSLDPPLVLVCVAATAGSFTAFRDSASFGVNILGEGQEPMADRFASKRSDKFADQAWTVAATGAPILETSLAWLDCSVHSRVMAGDHLILVGKVEGMLSKNGRPLVYSQGGFAQLGRSTREVRAGWLVESDDRILLARVDDGAEAPRWTVPASPLDRGGETLDAVRASAVQAVGVHVNVSFLYSAVDIAAENALFLVYRGQTSDWPHGDEGTRIRAFAQSEIPWHAIPDRHIRNMLRRYLHERTGERFGIYLGSAEEGRVAMVDRHRPWALHARALDGVEDPDQRALA